MGGKFRIEVVSRNRVLSHHATRATHHWLGGRLTASCSDQTRQRMQRTCPAALCRLPFVFILQKKNFSFRSVSPCEVKGDCAKVKQKSFYTYGLITTLSLRHFTPFMQPPASCHHLHHDIFHELGALYSTRKRRKSLAVIPSPATHERSPFANCTTTKD
jgi:hypothetical protein